LAKVLCRSGLPLERWDRIVGIEGPIRDSFIKGISRAGGRIREVGDKGGQFRRDKQSR